VNTPEPASGCRAPGGTGDTRAKLAGSLRKKTEAVRSIARRAMGVVAFALLGVLTTGCATTAAVDAASPPAASAGAAPPEVSKADPWERWNRKVYSFNDAVDVAVIKPVATAYVKVVPEPVRAGVNNFYGNFSDAWSAVNNVLQGKVVEGLQDVMRVGTNTVFGLAGVFDVASEIGLDRHNEDFGQTLGRWGVGAGPYIVWPLLGPSTVRDSLAMPLDRAVSPSLLLGSDVARAGLLGIGLVNERANLLPTTRMLDDMALDKYSFVRDAYLQRRRSLVYDGNEPPEDDEPVSAAAEPAAPASAVPPAAATSVPRPAAPASAASQPSR
jgi:phospholipid-binding lipoprotein MlaA